MVEKWSDVTLGQWKRLNAIDPESEDRTFEMVAVLCDTTLDDILNRPLPEVSGLVKKLNFLAESKPRTHRVKTRYRLGDTTYVFNTDYRELTVSQYIDFTNIPKGPEHLTELLTVFLIPKDKAYGQGYNIEKVMQDIDTYLTLEEANSLSAFFLQWWETLLWIAEIRAGRSLRKAVKAGAVTREQMEETLETIRGLRTAING